ncbi:MAG: hypothetical protein H6601_12390 [Flavobacteriales bacterium]|nr:hypothetical protein [Flavobacteriales bacterium]MCB9187528.1 hypothetical protein [Flavobacteriales bacterium]MCB9190639.1 hypothetical protein [Flavobacteriales bacterium]
MRILRNTFKTVFSAICLLIASTTLAQDNVGIGTITPDPSALLEIQALDKGLLIPRTDTLSITNPATGLLIYTVTDSSFWYFDGIVWRRGVGPEGPEGPLIPGLHGQTMRYDTVFFDDWVANSFIWNNEYHVGINTDQPDSSAILHLVAEGKGFLAPQMDETSRDNIQNPAVGLVIVNTTDSTVDYFNGTCWLPTFAQGCDDCYLNITPSSTADTIDRVVSPTENITLDIVQTVGNPQQIAISIPTNLPSGLTATITPNPAPSTGVVDIEFEASPFAPAGTYPIVIQVLCNNSVYNIVYSLTIEPCYEIDVVNSVFNYDLATAFYQANPTVPSSVSVCVVNTVQPGVLITSQDATQPAYTIGNLAPGSVVALVNDGYIIGRGGDGGVAYDPANGFTGDGEDGGDAVNATLDATIVNNAAIYGGGGGGGSMAFSLAYTTPSIPIIGSITIGFFVGSGGGGGAGLGEGGDYNTNLFIGFAVYDEGEDGTGGIGGVQGQGGQLNAPFNFTVSIATVTITPNTNGGDGGPYGFAGTQGSFGLSLTVTITVPIIGNIPIGPINIPIPVPPPLAGEGGYAIKHFGNTINIPDNIYNTSQLKGQVGP